jgi:hypothetical protein
MANEFLEDEEEDIDEEAAVAKLLASEAPAAAAVPEAEVEAEGDPDVLREYFSRRNKEDMDQMSRAEETSSQNRFIANMGGAASTLANALTGRQNDLSAFEKMAADAKSPVDRVERQQKSKKESDKLVSNYIAQKYKLASAAKTKAEDRAHQTSRDQANRDFLLKRDAAKRAGMPQKLAPEDQAMVSTLSQKTANKISVANQIEAAFKDWERLNDSEKLSRGRSMLKVINSSEGADAIWNSLSGTCSIATQCSSAETSRDSKRTLSATGRQSEPQSTRTTKSFKNSLVGHRRWENLPRAQLVTVASTLLDRSSS